MICELKGLKFRSIMGSDVSRDGMFLELAEDSNHANLLLEVFYSDRDGSMTLSAFAEAIPLPIVQEFISEAQRRLPPKTPP